MPVNVTDKEIHLSSADGSSTTRILLKGATLLSWKLRGKEQLWLSESATLEGPKGVRGGIPLVFPTFGPSVKSYALNSDEMLPQHGFARNTEFEFLGLVNDDETCVRGEFGLGPENLTEKFRELWPYDFTLIFGVELKGNSLKTDVTVKNASFGENAKPWEFHWLFHNYFKNPDDVKDLEIEGLDDLDYFNKVIGKEEHEEAGKTITVSGEVDRVYKNAGLKVQKSTGEPKPVVVKSKGKEWLIIERENLDDIVVWNPWENDMGDFSPKTGYKDMICVETGTVSHFITLQPGEQWVGSQVITAKL